MAEWIYDPKWGYTFDGRSVWIDWWLVGDLLKSVYTSESLPDDSKRGTE